MIVVGSSDDEPTSFVRRNCGTSLHTADFVMASTTSTTTVPQHAAGHAAHGHHASFAHPMPVWKLVAVFVALVLLTLATVGASMLPLGPLEIWVSMGIATIKAALVALFFMHLLHDRGFNQMIFVATFLFAALFILFLLLDASQYLPDVEAYQLDPQS